MPLVTSKIALTAVFADVGWQYLSQEADIHFTEKHKIGEMMTEDFMNFIYPFALAGAAWLMARTYSTWSKKEKKEDDYIFFNIIMGMAGWMAGYYFIPMMFEGDYNDFEMGAFAGVGALVLSILYNVWFEGWQTVKANPKAFAVMAVCFFASAFMWYMSYLTPSWILESTGSEPGSQWDKWSRGLIAEAVTAVGALLIMAPMAMMEMKKTAPQQKLTPT